MAELAQQRMIDGITLGQQTPQGAIECWGLLNLRTGKRPSGKAFPRVVPVELANGRKLQPLQLKDIASQAKRRCYDRFSSVFYSLDEYIGLLESIDSAVDTTFFRTNQISGYLHISSLGDLRFFWAFTRQPTVASYQFISASAEMLFDWPRMAGTSSGYAQAMRALDDDETDYSTAASAIKDALNIETVLVWSKSPTDSLLHQIGSTSALLIDASPSRGFIGKCVERRSPGYIPNSTYIREVIDFQHPTTVVHEGWKGFIIAPLFNRNHLIGVTGLYSKSTILLTRREVAILNYYFSVLTRKLVRDLISGKSEADQLEKIFQLAPSIYVGLKSTYRLHSIKNSVMYWGRRIDALHDLAYAAANRKAFMEAIGESAVMESLKETKDGIFEIGHDLERQLHLASGTKTAQYFKNEELKHLVTAISKPVIEWVGGTNIVRTIKKTFPKDTTVFCDKVALEQACFNVIENAFFFLEKDAPSFAKKKTPELHLEFKVRDGICEIAIRDNASGMTADELSNARKMYFSGERKMGTGLGLWMTDRIIRDHHGKMVLRSSEAGTHAVISLPVTGEKGDRIDEQKHFGGDV